MKFDYEQVADSTSCLLFCIVNAHTKTLSDPIIQKKKKRDCHFGNVNLFHWDNDNIFNDNITKTGCVICRFLFISYEHYQKIEKQEKELLWKGKREINSV